MYSNPEEAHRREIICNEVRWVAAKSRTEIELRLIHHEEGSGNHDFETS